MGFLHERTILAAVFSAALLSGCGFRIGTALPYDSCDVYENPVRLPRDAEGWTVFTPSPDSRIMYVSVATGDDATARAYGPDDAEIGADPFNPVGAMSAFRTYAAAHGLARDGYPDWILFRRGESHDGVMVSPLAGRGEGEYSLVASYGAGALPVLGPIENTPVVRCGTDGVLQYFAVKDLDCYNPAHDPANYPPGTMPPEGAHGLDMVTGNETLRMGLFEGLRFRSFTGNVIQAYNGGAVRDIAIRRCVFLDNHRGDRENGHAQGIFAGWLDGFFMEECVFDHNGWYNRDDGDDGVELPGEATMFNHNTYFADCRDITFRNNLFLRASSMGNKFTANIGIAGSSPNIALQGNLYFDGEIGIGLGGNVPTAHKFKGALVEGNVFTEIGRSRPTDRTLGWALEVQDWDGGMVKDNLFIHNPHPEVDNTYAISIIGGTRDVLIIDNLVYGQNEAGNNRWGLGLTVDATFEKENIKVNGNTFQEPASACIFIDFDEEGLAAAFDFRANRFWAPGEDAPLGCFRAGTRLLSYDQWRSLAGGSSAFGPEAFPDPSRDIASYQAGPGGGGGIDEFIAACRSQNRDVWNFAYEARAINAWLRAGFGR